MGNILRLVALALMFGAAPVAAQDPAIPGEVSQPIAPCELHAWPGNGLRSTYSGWFHGGIVDGAVQGRDGYRKLPDQPLPTSRQLDVLRTLALADLLGLPGYRVTVHENSLDSHALRRTQGRLVQGSAACHAELAVDDVFFQEDIIDGRFLKVLLRFRRFDGGDVPSRSFGTYIEEKLLKFPPKTAEEDAGPALDELRNAFAAVVRDFGAALNKPPKKSRK